MNMLKKVLTVVLSLALLASAATMGAVVSAEETSGALSSIRWFPTPTEKQNDDAWEVECVADGCLCQRFTETAEDTGNSNFLDTSYDENGALTLTRNDAAISLNGTDMTGWYWPRIRTVSLETSPEFDFATANILYFDITAHGSTQWNLSLGFNGMVISVGKFMAAAAGSTVDPKDTAVTDAPAGTFKGSINLTDTIAEIAATSALSDSVNAQAIKNMKKCFVPQVQVYVVGDNSASLTINELFISTADDTTGDKCTFIDMGVLTGLGDEYYELMEDNAAVEGGDTAEGDTTEGDANEGDASEGDASEDETTKATTTTTKKSADSESGSALPIVIAVVAVVVVAAIVVIVLVKKKKA